MIEVKALNFTYMTDQESGLKNINLQIKRGEFVVLCGRSGCGKTTLTRALNGLIPHFFEGEFSGTVSMEGLEVSREDLSKTADYVGSVFQNPASQFFHMDTDGEFAFGCENQAMEPEKIRERVEKSVRLLQLEHLTGRNIFELSGGEKQQVACGSVYAASPQIYVLDEPSSNLDVSAITRLKRTLRLLKEEGNTIVISEHRLYYLMELADRFLYLEHGEIKRSYLPDHIWKMPEKTREALGLRIPRLKGLKFTAPGHKKSKSVLKITQLECIRNKKNILSIDDLDIPEQAIVAVIGENGAGKSTFAECVSGLLKCKGQIYARGRLCKPKTRVRNSYIVMQDVNRQLFCDSVSQEITLGLTNRQPEQEQELLARMGLSLLKEKHPASLSGGQKQRVAICAAISAEKQWLFYDEPTSGLDYEGMQRFGTLLQMNQSKAMVSFVITHDLELILCSCTHVLHLERGQLKEFYQLDGNTAEHLKKLFISEEREDD